TVFHDVIPDGVDLFANVGQTVVFLVLLTLLITLLSGLYPGWLAGRVQTIYILKGKTLPQAGKHTFTLRKGLIVFQFIIAQVFIVSSFIVAQQLHYVLHTDLGFNHEAMLTVEIPYRAFREPENYGKEQILKQELRKHTEIANVALGDMPMGTPMGGKSLYHQGDGANIKLPLGVKLIDTDYLELYGLKLLAGHNLRPS